MKTKFILLVMAIMIFWSENNFAQCSMMNMNNQNNKTQHQKMNAGRQNATATEDTVKIIYTCSMHPEIIADQPGICPKCGMELVKKEADEKNKAKMKMKKTGMMGMKKMGIVMVVMMAVMFVVIGTH